MVGMATVTGGVKHGLAVLSHAERAAAESALAKLNRPSGAAGSHAGSVAASATVLGGVKSAAFSGSTLIHGQGNDTFLGGARGTTTRALANIGNDTVVSGSAGGSRSLADAAVAHTAQHFSLSSDTINVKGATAEAVKGLHKEGATAGSHTITLADKTTVTIAGLTKHDIGKLPH